MKIKISSFYFSVVRVYRGQKKGFFMNDLILKDDAYKIVGACFAGRKIILKKAMAIACIAFCGLFCFSQEVEFKIDKISLSEDKGKAELELSLKNLTDNKYSISIRNMSIIIRGVDNRSYV